MSVGFGELNEGEESNRDLLFCSINITRLTAYGVYFVVHIEAAASLCPYFFISISFTVQIEVSHFVLVVNLRIVFGTVAMKTYA